MPNVKLKTENRLTRLEEGQIRLEEHIVNIKENHLAHLAADITELKDNQKWAIRFIIGSSIGLILWALQALAEKALAIF